MKCTHAVGVVSLLVLVATVAPPAGAVTVSFDSNDPQAQDATIYTGNTDAPLGVSYTGLEVSGNYGGGAVRSVLQFDVGSIAGAYSSIDAITLRLTTSYNAGATTIDIHEAVNSWVESQVTWNSRFTGTPWNTPGGDFAAAVLGSIDTSTLNMSASFDGVDEQVTVSLLPGPANAAAREALIDSWTSGSNEGLLLKESLEPGPFVGFRDRSRAADDDRPLLTIDYTPIPEPAGLSLLACGVAALALVRRRHARPVS